MQLWIKIQNFLNAKLDLPTEHFVKNIFMLLKCLSCKEEGNVLLYIKVILEISSSLVFTEQSKSLLFSNENDI